MSNPWEEISLSDYENHMRLESVYQLQSLNKMMREQFEIYSIDTVMILGIAGGNGLEHIRREKISRVYGVDVNRDYLALCKERYAELGNIFEPICADLLDDNLCLPCADLLIANLLIEYIGYDCFTRVVEMVNPKYVSCVIQINTGESFVSDSPYIHAFDCLEAVHHQMEALALTTAMSGIDYRLEFTSEELLPNGKKLVRLDFMR